MSSNPLNQHRARHRITRKRDRSGWVAAAVALVAMTVAAGCGATEPETAAAAGSAGRAGIDLGPAGAAADYDGFRAQPTACAGMTPEPRTEMGFDAPGDMGLGGAVTATIETSCGPIEIALDADRYPQTVNSFVFLSEQGYFDGTACHRVVPGFMTQCGDPTATGVGGPGYVVPDEFPASGFVYDRGVVAMANAGPGSTGSQFFVVTGDASHLPNGYSVLGTVVGSEDTLAAIEALPIGVDATGREQSSPRETLYIERVVINR